MKLPNIKIVEVGPRDGLQNESQIIPTAIKVAFVDRLANVGLKNIEVTSFVSPHRIPQLADAVAVLQQIQRIPEVQYSALIANEKGLNDLIASNPNAIAVFTAASETFCQKNIHCSIAESFQHFIPVIETAKKMHLFIRGYISCALGCPYEGYVPHERVTAIAQELLHLGCDEIDLGDTVGYGTPLQVKTLIQDVSAAIPIAKLAVHFHDTYGQALANIYAALESGITTIDSAVAGLGGCPYAPGATGNVASEDVVYLLEGLGVNTGIDLEALSLVGKYISDYLGRPTRSKAGAAILSKKEATY